MTLKIGELRRFAEWMVQTIKESEAVRDSGFDADDVVTLAQRDFQTAADVPYYVVVGMPGLAAVDDTETCMLWMFKSTIAIAWNAEGVTDVSLAALEYMDFQWGVLRAFEDVLTGHVGSGHYKVIDIDVAKDTEFDRFRFLDENHWYSAYTISTSAK